MPVQIPFTYAAALVQMTGTIEEAMAALESTGHI